MADDALEAFLALLDRHQQLHARLGRQLAAGFLLLATANRSSPHRIGRDLYDHRMKASRSLYVPPACPRPPPSPSLSAC